MTPVTFLFVVASDMWECLFKKSSRVFHFQDSYLEILALDAGFLVKSLLAKTAHTHRTGKHAPHIVAC